MTPHIDSVTLKAVTDTDPPLDHLGRYQDEPGPDDRTIDREARGDRRPGELRYFISETAEYADENYERMEEYASGGVASYGIRAVANVSVAGTVQRVESPGLWGVPSDADQSHATGVASEQLHVLREVLDAFGVEHDPPLSGEWEDGAPWSGVVSE